MQYRDYYKLLGVSRNASAEQIKKQYRQLAKKYHPDMNPDNKAAEQKFKEINEAHEVLSDPKKRARYDQLGPDWERFARAGAGWAPPWGGRGGRGFRVRWEDMGQAGDFSDFFKTMFGDFFGGSSGFEVPFAGQAAAAPRAGRDLEQKLEITLEEAYYGTRRILRVRRDDPCSSCRGAGCSKCGGKGIVSQTRQLEVKIPPGVGEGARVRLAGEGEAGLGGRSGDLYLLVSLQAHPIFERRGDDLHCEVELPVWLPVLGGETEVPTLTGRVAMKVPAGTQGGQTFRLKGQGMPVLKGKSKGALYVRVRTRLPSAEKPEVRKLFEELRRLEGEAD